MGFFGRFAGAWPPNDPCLVCVECYPGVFLEDVERAFTEGLQPSSVIATRSLLKSPEKIESMLAPYLGDDPVFGRMNGVVLEDFFDLGLLA